MALPLSAGALPYLLRAEPIAPISGVGRLVAGEGFAAAWTWWSARSLPLRLALGPWLMGHASDAALAVATAGFVDLAQTTARRPERLTWHASALALLAGLEIAQGPLGFGTFDPQDLALIAAAYVLVAMLCERANRAARL